MQLSDFDKYVCKRHTDKCTLCPFFCGGTDTSPVCIKDYSRAEWDEKIILQTRKYESQILPWCRKKLTGYARIEDYGQIPKEMFERFCMDASKITFFMAENIPAFNIRKTHIVFRYDGRGCQGTDPYDCGDILGVCDQLCQIANKCDIKLGGQFMVRNVVSGHLLARIYIKENPLLDKLNSVY